MFDLYLPPKSAIIIPRPAEIVRPGDPRFVVPAGLTVNQLIGFGDRGTPKDLTFLTSVSSTADLTTYTFSAVNFGAESADRRIIVAASQRRNPAPTFSSATIGGVSATSVVTGVVTQVSNVIFIAAVPTGTSGDIVVTWASGALRMSIGVWRCTGLTSNTAHHTGSSTADPGSITLNTLLGGFAISISGINASSTHSWTNATERFDLDEGEVSCTSGADAVDTPAGTLNIQCDYSSADTNRQMIAASW